MAARSRADAAAHRSHRHGEHRVSLFVSDRSQGTHQFGRIYPSNPQWLRRRPPEPVLEPALPVIDCHHHLWEVPGNRYLLEDFEADLQCGHHVIATVYMEGQQRYRTDGPTELRPVGETEEVVRVTAAAGDRGGADVARGIVAFADLRLGERVQPVLEAHVAAGAGRLCGIRFASAWDADARIGNSFGIDAPHALRRADVRAGIARVAALGLALDAWVFHPQLAEVGEIAAAFPDLTVVLGHTGGVLGYGPYAGRREEIFAQWHCALRALARHPNIVVKLGGMLMRLAAIDYPTLAEPPSSQQLAACWKPYMQACIEAFGADRCMFESNFPVEKMGVSYANLWNAFKRIAADASPDEKCALFHATARRVYRLD